MSSRVRWLMATAVALTVLLVPISERASAHCDSLDGPVAAAARRALDSGEQNEVLGWVAAEQEADVRRALLHARSVRSLGDEARELADTFFLETVVRLHRASEGAPYTGLKPAGTTSAVLVAADRALDAGDVDELADRIGDRVRDEIRVRFRKALDSREVAASSVESQRVHVREYVEYMHLLEGLHAVLHGDAHEDHE